MRADLWLVEAGHFRKGDPVIEEAAREYLAQLQDKGIDTLILGCTHYPLLADIIAEIMGPEVTLIDSGRESACELQRVLSESDLLTGKEQGCAEFFVSGDPETFAQTADFFLEKGYCCGARRIDIEQF